MAPAPAQIFIGLDDKKTPPTKKKYIGLDEEDSPSAPRPYKDPITSTTEKVAPAIGRFVVESLPMAGSFFGIPGILAGTALKTGAKVLRPDLVGQPPQGFEGAIMDQLKDLAIHGVVPKVLSGLGGLAIKTDMQGLVPTAVAGLKNFPAVREGLIKSISKQLRARIYPETGIIEQGAENVGSRFEELSDAVTAAKEAHPQMPLGNQSTHPEVLAAMEALGGTFGKNDVGKMLLRMQKEAAAVGGDIARTQTYKQISNAVLSDVTRVQNAKLAGAGEEFTRDLATNRILTRAGNPTEETIDAVRALKEMRGGNSEIYKEAMGESYDRLTGILEELQGHQTKNFTDTVLKYANHKLIYSGAGLALGTYGHAAGGVALASGIPLTNAILRRIISNPRTAQLVRLALTTPAKAPQGKLINKAITEILPRIIQGETAGVFMPEK